jgi:hypothetical protein
LDGLLQRSVAFGRFSWGLRADKFAKPLLRVLRARGGHVETDVIPGEGHVFGEAGMAVVRPKVAKFFARLR